MEMVTSSALLIVRFCAALPSVLSMVTSPLLVIFALRVTALLSAERITSLESSMFRLPFTAMNPPLRISTLPVHLIVLVSYLAIIAASSLLLTFTLRAFSTINFAATAI